MSLYLRVKVTALIKIQEPYDDAYIDEVKDGVFLNSPVELIEENYEFEVEDEN